MRQTSEPKNLETLASRIRWIIEERQIKQTDFARALGISVNYVYLLTSGRKTSISETLARLIERTYGYSAQWVLSGKRPELAEIADSDHPEGERNGQGGFAGSGSIYSLFAER